MNINGVVTEHIRAFQVTLMHFMLRMLKQQKVPLDWKNIGDTLLYSTGKKIGIGTSAPQASVRYYMAI